jgi:AcrR family transcriptional regulator
VNIDPVIKPPAKREPPWPAFPMVVDEATLRERGRATRERLLEAGSVVLPQRGYHDTRVDDIVEAAGVSHGTFYRYFDSKDALFRVLAQRAARTMVELVTTYPAEASEADLQTWLRGWFDSYEENGGVISTWQEIKYDDSDLAAFSLDIAVAVFDRLRRIVSWRGFGDSTVGALFLLAVVERVPYSSQALSYVDRDDAIRAAATFIRRGILGAAD